MSVQEIQALAERFANAFDKRDMKTVLEMLSEDVEVFDHVPYRFDGKPLFAKSKYSPGWHPLRAAAASAPGSTAS